MLGLYKPLARERGVVAQGLLAQLAAALTEQHVSLFLGQKKKYFVGREPGTSICGYLYFLKAISVKLLCPLQLLIPQWGMAIQFVERAYAGVDTRLD